MRIPLTVLLILIMIARLCFHPAYFLTLCLSPMAMADTVIDVSTYGAVANSGQDATQAFKNAITAAAGATKPVTLNIPQGRYDFYSANATKRACYFSNATENGSDAIRTIALDLSNLDQVTLQGNGSTLMMRGAMTMVVAEQSTDLSLLNLSFDFARPPVSEIKVISKGSDHWVGEVHPDSTYTITGGNRVRWDGEDWQSYHNMCQPYNPTTKTTWRGSDPTSGATSIQDLGNRQLKFFVSTGTLSNATVGYSYQFRNTVRDQAGMWFSRCRNITMQDVNVYAMRGFGILSQFTENIHYKRIHAAPKEGSGRTAASAADILHFSGCKGSIRIEDSCLAAAHDDAMNVHGTHLRIVAQPAANQIRVRFMHAQTWGFQAFQNGDEIEFVKPGTLLSYGNAVVTNVQMLTDKREQLLTLDRNAPAGVTLNSDAVENITWTPSVEVTNCDISQIPTRGFLLTSRRSTVIQGCRFFRTQMPAILVEDDAAGWYESGPVKDMTLRGNAFFECQGSTIDFSPQNSTHAGAVHSNINVIGNDFTLTGGNAMHFKSTSNINVTGNRFRMRNNTTPAVTSLTSSSNVSGINYSNNVVEAASTPAISSNNGTFEAPATNTNDEAEVIPDGWWGPGNGIVRHAGAGRTLSDAASSYTASRSLYLGTNGAIYQRIGPFDPAQGSTLRWSLLQLKSSQDSQPSGPLNVEFFAWDGRFTPAADTNPVAAGMVSLGQFAVPAMSQQKTSRLYKGNLDLSRYPAGTAVWARISTNATQAARIDNFSATLASAPDLTRYSAWAEDSSLSGADADPTADPDHDGLCNLLEYALDGCDPLTPDSASRLITQKSGSLLRFLFQPREAADIQLLPQFQFAALTSNGWQTVQDGLNGLTYVSEGSSHVIEVNPALVTNAFFRLQAQFLPIAPPSVINGSFESPDLTGASPAYSSGNPTGWSFTSSIGGGVEEIRDSRFGAIGSEGTRLDGLGGKGDQVGYINLGSSSSATASALSDTIGLVAPNTIYTLRISFGQRTSGDRHPLGSFGLNVNGTNVGTFTSLGALAAGFNERIFEWQSPGYGDPLVGQPLQIRMSFSYDAAAGSWQQAQFDNVRLEATPAP